MAASYLTTDIIVIIALVILIVLIGVCAFLVHFYWTKIGVAEIWNTAKWSSMRSSFYQSISRFRRPKASKYVEEESLSRVSIHSGDIDNVAIQKKISSPMITSYSTPANINFANGYPTKPVSIISYSNPPYQSYATRTGHSIDNTKMPTPYQSNSRYNDLASKIQKQRF